MGSDTQLIKDNSYAQLIKDVKAVDRIAALKLAKKIPLRNKRGLMPHRISNTDLLIAAFVWNETEEGYPYWLNVARKVAT